MRPVLWMSAALCAAACFAPAEPEQTLRAFPISAPDGVLTRTGVEFDTEVTSDGDGSLRLVATEPTTFRLFEFDDIDVEDARLIYRARLRTEGVKGRAYLEMWCGFPGLGEYFSRALEAPLTGSVEWTTQEAPFFLEPGQNPERVKLNVVVEGSGTVWIDEIALVRGPR